MAEKPDNVGGVEVTEAEAGPGHNQPKEVVWERWQKKRTFVRALEGTYGELQQGLMDQPRIYKSKDWAWKGGPQFFRQADHQPAAYRYRAVDRNAHLGHRTGRHRPAPRAYELGIVLYPVGQGLRHP